MHKQLTIQGDRDAIRQLALEVRAFHGVITLSHHPNGSLKPDGDVLQMDVLNQEADAVLRAVEQHAAWKNKKLVVAVAQSTALLDPAHEDAINHDADEMLWEEMSADLRNHGRLSVNYLLLMSLGGVIAAAGLMLDSVSQSIAFVGASIIAPAFEPVAKVAQSLVLRKFRICGQAVVSLLIGYTILFAAAFTFFFLFSRSNVEHATPDLRGVSMLRVLTRLEIVPLVTSACAAVAGILMVVSLRDLYVVGPLMVLVVMPGLAVSAASLATGQGAQAARALGRVGVDLALIVVLGAAVFYWKQRRFHRRRPLA